MLQETHAAEDFFNQEARSWDMRRRAASSVLRTIVQAAAPPEGSRILDVACGTGIMVEPLLQTHPSLLRAIDLSPEMVRLAKQKYSTHPRVQISVQDFYTFSETGFDLIMVYNAYPHFMDKAKFSAQLARCLPPGGRFVIAHGTGREHINACHFRGRAHAVSAPLLPCRAEAERLGNCFSYDVMKDCNDMYILSGRKNK